MECCRTCSETFILGQNYPHCMDNNCKKIWTRKFMTRKFTNDFMNKKYKKHREQILFEQEQSLLPATQLIIERNQYRQNEMMRIQEKSNKIDKQIQELRIKQMHYLRYYEKLRNNNFTINEDLTTIFNDEETIDEEMIDRITKTEDIFLEKKQLFVRRCTNDNCLGFLSSKWKCSLCDTWTCNKCFINMGNDEIKATHVCNNDDLETAKLIKSDCKSCPKCGINIFKIMGCDQMFCTNCNTPFCWKTGEIQIGRNIHNPHYFEYIKQNKQNLERHPLDIPCGVELTSNLVARLDNLVYYISPLLSNVPFVQSIDDAQYLSNLLVEIGRNIIHLNNVIIRDLNNQIDNYGKCNQTERIRYMTKIIDEEQFKKNIQTNEKKNLKNKEYIELYVMVRDTASDLIRKFYNITNKYYQEYLDSKYNSDSDSDSDSDNNIIKRKRHAKFSKFSKINLQEKIEREKQQKMKNQKRLEILKNELEMEQSMPDQLIQELDSLRCYANECLIDISKTYKCVKKEFDEKYDLINSCKK